MLILPHQVIGGRTDHLKRLTDLETENARLRKAISDLTLDNVIMQEAAKELLSPARLRAVIEHIRRTFQLSERRA